MQESEYFRPTWFSKSSGIIKIIFLIVLLHLLMCPCHCKFRFKFKNRVLSFLGLGVKKLSSSEKLPLSLLSVCLFCLFVCSFTQCNMLHISTASSLCQSSPFLSSSPPAQLSLIVFAVTAEMEFLTVDVVGVYVGLYRCVFVSGGRGRGGVAREERLYII
jgi:hypothetical protein